MSAATVNFSDKQTGDLLFALEVNALRDALNQHARLLDNPTAAAKLYQGLTRTQAVSVLSSNPPAVVPGLLYGISASDWNGNGQPATVYVLGQSAGAFGLVGELLVGGVRSFVQVDVLAATATPIGPQLNRPITRTDLLKLLNPTPGLTPGGYVVSDWNGNPNLGVAMHANTRGTIYPLGTITDGSGNPVLVLCDVRAGTYELLEPYIARVAGASGGGAYSAGQGISISSAHVISADQVPTYLEITSTNGLRIRELTVPGPLQIMDEVLDKNATAVRYQVDTNTRTGPRRYGTSNLSLLNVAQDLAALTPADYASGVKLSIYTVATSAPDDAMIALKLYSQYNLVLATSRLGNFPTDPGAPQSLLTNSLFTQPFTGDEATGWQTSGGWSWDSVNLLALASNGQFLYQRNSTAMTVGGKYRVVVRIADRPDGTPTSGSLSFANGSGTTLVVPAGAAPGTYTIEFTASVASERLHLSGQAFTGAVAEFSIFRS